VEASQLVHCGAATATVTPRATWTVELQQRVRTDEGFGFQSVGIVTGSRRELIPSVSAAQDVRLK
jgi:hypothetical protein